MGSLLVKNKPLDTSGRKKMTTCYTITNSLGYWIMVTYTNHALVQLRSRYHKLLHHSKLKGEATKLKAPQEVVIKNENKRVNGQFKETDVSAVFQLNCLPCLKVNSSSYLVRTPHFIKLCDSQVELRKTMQPG